MDGRSAKVETPDACKSHVHSVRFHCQKAGYPNRPQWLRTCVTSHCPQVRPSPAGAVRKTARNARSPRSQPCPAHGSGGSSSMRISGHPSCRTMRWSSHEGRGASACRCAAAGAAPVAGAGAGVDMVTRAGSLNPRRARRRGGMGGGWWAMVRRQAEPTQPSKATECWGSRWALNACAAPSAEPRRRSQRGTGAVNSKASQAPER